MTCKINNGRPAAGESKPVTFDEADDLGGYTLAARWSDRAPWPLPGDADASGELTELAFMSALARWLGRLQPIPIHRAILAGAAPGAVAAARLAAASPRRSGAGIVTSFFNFLPLMLQP